jgi:protocatechuate 3,4-dioxygenase beta subunit
MKESEAMSQRSEMSRRVFLSGGVGGLFLVAPVLFLPSCRRALPGDPMPAESAPPNGARPPASPASTPIAPPPLVARACGATDDNIEGPYYRVGAPLRSNLIDAGIVGAAFTLSGRVLSLDCKTPLAGAELDIWQADGQGRYDNDGTFGARAALRLRGKVRTDARGAFDIKTIVPGRYLNGSQYRPAHIHFKVSAAGHQPLTTQLYFPDDPYNRVDPFIKQTLVMDVASGASGKLGQFDFVLPPV